MESTQTRQGLIEKLQFFDPNQDYNQDDHSPGQHHYNNYYEYLLSIIGYSVGYGSFWRFPYLLFKNGGGAFLIPYFFAIVFLGIPLLYLQVVTGQMHQKSTPLIFARINKGYKMLGITFLFICFHCSGYYNIVLTYSYRFLFSAFLDPLPFAQQSVYQNNYFDENILHTSDSIASFGTIHPFLFILYSFSLYLCYRIVKDGVKSSGKIVVVTSLLPYAVFIILAVRGIFLQGAMNGIKYLIIPDFKKLLKLQIWIDAIVQVFYQFGIAAGAITSLSSLKPKRQKYLAGVYLIPLSIIICGMLSAINIFMYLGHFCHKQGEDITNISLSGLTLSFNIFPKALSVLPWPNFWVFLFFITMVLLGIDTEFGFLESIFCYFNHEGQSNQKGQIRILNQQYPVQKVKYLVIGCIMVFCPFLTSSAGIFYLQYFDRFLATIPLSIGAVINYIFFIKIVSFEEVEKESKKYTGQQAPFWIKQLLEGKIVICILLGNLGLTIFNQFFYFSKYPTLYYFVGWALGLYPYVIAYFYYQNNKEDANRTTFLEFKQFQREKTSQL